jgi:peroxiredoxin
MTIKVGETLPEATLTEFIEIEGNGCSVGPNAFKVADLVKGKKLRCSRCRGLSRPPARPSTCPAT